MDHWNFGQAGFFHVPLVNAGTGHFELSGRLNGATISLFLDTGASSTVIDLAVARRLGIDLTPIAEKGGGAGAARMQLWRLDVPLVIEDRAITPPDGLYAMDLSHVAAALKSRGFAAPDAVLGADVLIPRAAVIDYGARALYLREQLDAAAA